MGSCLDSDTISSALKTLIPGLGRLDPALADALVRGAHRVAIPDAHIVFSEGDTCDTFLIVLTGILGISKASADGRELLLYRLHPGDVCPLSLSSLLGDSPYPATARAETDLEGLLLPRAHVLRLMEELPGFRARIFARFAERLAVLLELVTSVAFDRLEQRLAARLLELTAEVGLDLTVTHQRLADDLGSARENVSRILEEFAERGAVLLGRKSIRVIDRLRLQTLAGRPRG